MLPKTRPGAYYHRYIFMYCWWTIGQRLFIDKINSNHIIKITNEMVKVFLNTIRKKKHKTGQRWIWNDVETDGSDHISFGVFLGFLFLLKG